MTSLAGNSLLIFALISSFCAIILQKNYKILAFYISSITTILSLLLLIFAFVVSDFSAKNVFFNSSSELPTLYKIAASWASHEGSMLLWIALLSGIAITYTKHLDDLEAEKDFAIGMFAFLQALLLSFLIFTSNPFEHFNFTPKQGLGLNPMLQDVALSIHPPLLYIGNVSYAALFVSGVLLLGFPKNKQKILETAKIFSNLALLFLTIGIGLGAWWAYRELGWGGYWFFDPVENISLMPWLSGIALHHFLIVSARGGKYLRWVISLSLANFLLILYGTFIVRSGIISSVHSFAFSPERGLYIFAICLALTILSISYFLWKKKFLPKQKAKPTRFEHLILWGNILWITSLLVIIITLIYPIYCSLVHDIEIAIDPAYFTSVFIPIFIPILILAGMGPGSVVRKNNMSFPRRRESRNLKTFQNFQVLLSNFYCQLRCHLLDSRLRGNDIAALLLAILITGALAFWVNFKIISFGISFASIYLMLKTIFFIKNQPASCKNYALFCGHFGFALLALSITFNVLLTKEINFKGKIGNQINSENLQITLTDMKFAQKKNYYRQIVSFEIKDSNNEVTTLKPENRLYKIENTLSQEVDIYSFLFYDFYAVLNKIDKDIIHASIYWQPFISFIWLSVFIIAAGFLLLLVGRRNT
jgi:cytochrome c-type biogenesis protein CcmF